MKAKPFAKSLLSKANFALGRNPKVWNQKDARAFLPDGKQAVLTITADFELAWAPRYDHSVTDAYAFAMTLAKQERRNVPGILKACDTFGVPITWATVGHLFLEACSPQDGHKHPEIAAVPAYQGPHWNFQGTDWFEYDPCTSLREAPEWYAPDLIQQISSASARHEIGCHTFSHIDCREAVCPPELFKSELKACRKLAEAEGVNLQSFVHPGLTVGHIDILEQEGFTSFQTDPGNILGLPKRRGSRIWELYRTAELEYRPEWGRAYHVQRFRAIVDRAIRSNTVCNFWFHPSFSPRVVEEVLPGLFQHIDQRREDIWVTTVSEYVNFLNSRHG